MSMEPSWDFEEETNDQKLNEICLDEIVWPKYKKWIKNTILLEQTKNIKLIKLAHLKAQCETIRAQSSS